MGPPRHGEGLTDADADADAETSAGEGRHVGRCALSSIPTWGTARGEFGDRRWLTAQTAAVLGCGALAVAATATAPGIARYLLAAGWLAHAAWDVAHHHTDRVVPRWYAELCMVCDVIIATALLSVGTF